MGRLHDLEMQDEATSRSAAERAHAKADTSAVTGKWSAFLGFARGLWLETIGPKQILRAAAESTRAFRVVSALHRYLYADPHVTPPVVRDRLPGSQLPRCP